MKESVNVLMQTGMRHLSISQLHKLVRLDNKTKLRLSVNNNDLMAKNIPGLSLFDV
jgi:hypothetical protein